MSEPSEKKRLKTPKRNRKISFYWLNLILLVIIVLCLNIVSYREYYRRDLTEDQRYEISNQTLNVLKSPLVTDKKGPIKIIFAFQRTTQNYTRMRALLEEYERHSNRKIQIECIDPLRQPNRAREIANLYGIEFKQNQVVVDAREDTAVSWRKGDPHVRFLEGKDFVVYEQVPSPSGEKMQLKAVALQMEDLLTADLISAIEGTPRKIYVAADKSMFGEDAATDETSVLFTLNRACRSLNLQAVLVRLNEIEAIPEDAAGFMLIGPQYDLTAKELDILNQYWNRPSSGIFMALNPHASDNKNIYHFLRQQGLRPQDDRILLKDRKKAYYEINALFTPAVEWTRDFWQQSTTIEGESFSLLADMDDPKLAASLISIYPLLHTTADYYGETKYTELNPQFDVYEDNPGPLFLSVAIEKGNTNDVKLAKETSRMVVMSNVDLLDPKKIKQEQRDFIRTSLSWITDREELSGLGSRHDLTIKLNLDRNALDILQLMVTIILPVLALLIGAILWNMRRH